MAHFALIDSNNIVVYVMVVNNSDIDNLPFPQSEPVGQAYIASLGIDGEWLQCSYNNNFRGRMAAIYFAYDSDIDEFVPTAMNFDPSKPPE
jgi:hypothetical protein